MSMFIFSFHFLKVESVYMCALLCLKSKRAFLPTKITGHTGDGGAKLGSGGWN